VCGERERGDDAAGPIALDGLPADVLALCEVRSAAALDVDALLDIPSSAACVLADAAIGVEPGAVVVLPLERLVGRREGAAPRSSHELPVEQVIGLAAVLRGGLPRGSFVGIGAAAADFGAPLSRSVEAALPAFRDAIAGEIRRLAAGRGTMRGDGHDPGTLRRLRGPLPDVVGAGPRADRAGAPRRGRAGAG
jgi:hydrogenase maturation protease